MILKLILWGYVLPTVLCFFLFKVTKEEEDPNDDASDSSCFIPGWNIILVVVLLGSFIIRPFWKLLKRMFSKK